MTFDWNRVQAFLVTAELGSYSAAARVLKVSQPTVGRQVAALEQELGLTLFQRVGNRLELTAPGLRLLGHARGMREAARALELTATGQAEAIEGAVCVTCSDLVAAKLLPPVVVRLRREHPGIELEIVANNMAMDLRKREADIAIRHFRPRQQDLIARDLGARMAYPYATPALIERLGIRELQDLRGGEFLSFDRSALFADAIEGLLGFRPSPASFPVVTLSSVVQWELMKAGVGIGFVMAELGDAEPSLRRVHADVPGMPVPMWLTCHQELKTSARIRVVFDLLGEVFGG